MDEDTNQIERAIRAERQQLGRNVDELQHRARQLADWRTYYRHNPKLLLGIALGGGLVLGSLAGRSAVHGSRDDDSQDTPARPSNAHTSVGREMEDLWRSIASALLGVASAKLISLVSDAVPGFEEHLPPHRARRSAQGTIRTPA